ncbi:hypothetical protein Tco_0795976 [Tanacetum coccineum]
MPFPRFTKVIINHFLSQHKSLSNLNYQHYHTIKDDGIVSRLKFVRIGEDYQEYGLPIPDMMLNDAIKQSESYQIFLKYSTSQNPPKKSRGKARKKTASRRVVKKKVTKTAAENIIPDLDVTLELGKSISLTKAARQVHATHARIVTESVPKPARRRQSSVAIRDTPQVTNKVSSDPSKKLKGVQSLTLEEQEVLALLFCKAGILHIYQISKLSFNVRKNALKNVSLKSRMNMLNFEMIGTKNKKNENTTKFRTIKLIMTCNKRSNGCNQLGDQKGKSQDTPCVPDTLDPLSQKLENENVELKFQVLNYAKENSHLKTTYKNLFNSINVTRTQTKTIIDSFQNKLHETIYENAKLRAQLFDKVSEQKDTTKGTSVNTQFCKQSILGKPPSSSSGSKLYSVTPFSKSKGLPKIDESHALSKPVTSNSAPSSRESNVVNNEKVIAPGIFRINPLKDSRVNNFVPNKHVKAIIRTKPIIVSRPHVITKKNVNSNTNGFSLKNVESTTRTR